MNQILEKLNNEEFKSELKFIKSSDIMLLIIAVDLLSEFETRFLSSDISDEFFF